MKKPGASNKLMYCSIRASVKSKATVLPAIILIKINMRKDILGIVFFIVKQAILISRRICWYQVQTKPVLDFAIYIIIATGT